MSQSGKHIHTGINLTCNLMHRGSFLQQRIDAVHEGIDELVKDRMLSVAGCYHFGA
jgi:hypothetical protein